MVKEKILITGASGCLGASLAKKLVSEGHDVGIFIIKGTWHPFLNGLRLKVFYGDVLDEDATKKAIKGFDYVYHVAGIVSYNKLDDKKVYAVNLKGTKNILRVCGALKVRKVVVTASTAGIGISKDKKPIDEKEPFDSKKYKKVMYMYSKYLCIKLCVYYSKKGLNVSMVSPTTVYGQGDMTMHIGNTIKKIKKGRIRFAPPGGNSVVSVDDIVDAHILVMKKGKSGENYIFANEFMGYLEMYNIIAKIVNGPVIKRTIPLFLLHPARYVVMFFEAVHYRFGRKFKYSSAAINFKFKNRYFNSTKARKELGWKPKISFEKSIKKAIKFYRAEGLM